jgi:hypothetical protein
MHFPLAMMAYNPNCWLMRFHRDEQATAEELKHTTLATARLRYLFLAAKMVRHAGAVFVPSSDPYTEQGILARLMNRRHSIVPGGRFAPVVRTPLRL